MKSIKIYHVGNFNYEIEYHTGLKIEVHTKNVDRLKQQYEVDGYKATYFECNGEGFYQTDEIKIF